MKKDWAWQSLYCRASIQMAMEVTLAIWGFSKGWYFVAGINSGYLVYHLMDYRFMRWRDKMLDQDIRDLKTMRQMMDGANHYKVLHQIDKAKMN